MIQQSGKKDDIEQQSYSTQEPEPKQYPKLKQFYNLMKYTILSLIIVGIFVVSFYSLIKSQQNEQRIQDQENKIKEEYVQKLNEINSQTQDLYQLNQNLQKQINTHSQYISLLQNSKYVFTYGTYEQAEDMKITEKTQEFTDLSLNKPIIINLNKPGNIFIFSQISIQTTNSEVRLRHQAIKPNGDIELAGEESIQQWYSPNNGVRTVNMVHMYEAKEAGEYHFTFQYYSYGGTIELFRYSSNIISISS